MQEGHGLFCWFWPEMFGCLNDIINLFRWSGHFRLIKNANCWRIKKQTFHITDVCSSGSFCLQSRWRLDAFELVISRIPTPLHDLFYFGCECALLISSTSHQTMHKRALSLCVYRRSSYTVIIMFCVCPLMLGLSFISVHFCMMKNVPPHVTLPSNVASQGVFLCIC